MNKQFYKEKDLQITSIEMGTKRRLEEIAYYEKKKK
jgi:hypothetical protein